MAKEDTFGDRMKGYERHETDRKFIPTLPVYVRLAILTAISDYKKN